MLNSDSLRSGVGDSTSENYICKTYAHRLSSVSWDRVTDSRPLRTTPGSEGWMPRCYSSWVCSGLEERCKEAMAVRSTGTAREQWNLLAGAPVSMGEAVSASLPARWDRARGCTCAALTFHAFDIYFERPFPGGRWDREPEGWGLQRLSDEKKCTSSY
jgi:hypothetical protein